jgi:hypothetical protein
MKHFAMLCAALAVAACSTRDKSVADTAGGAMSADTTMGAGMSAGGTAGTASDTGAMSGTSSGTAGTSGTGTGTSGTGTAAAGSTNQTQSGVTNAKTGQSTLGPNIRKADPTQGAAVTRKGQTLKPGGDSVPHTKP